MSIISGTIGAIMGANSQDKATETNRKNVRDTNRLNYQMFRESRGEGGSAVLPLYLRSKGGGLFEEQLGRDLVDAYDNLKPKSIDEYRTRLGAIDPMKARALATVGKLFDGGLEAEAKERFKPVAAARSAMSRQAAMEGLARTLAEIDAASASSGTGGDSMTKRLLQFEANKGMATDVANANLQNLEEERGIGDLFAGEQLRNAGLPYQMAQDELKYLRLPEEEYLNALLKQQDPFRFLYMGPGTAFRNEQLPTEGAKTSAWQILAQAGAQTGNMALDYWLKQQQAQAWTRANSPNWGTAAAAGTLAGSYGTGSGGALAGAADLSPEMMDYLGTLA